MVEDDFAIRSLITSALEIEGYKYHVAKDGKQAIIEATTQNPELILLDLGLPDNATERFQKGFMLKKHNRISVSYGIL